MSHEESKLEQVKAVIQDWLDSHGHDRCWYYPDIFNRLVSELDLIPTRDPGLPTREEFDRGCRRYADEQYGRRTREDRGREVREAYRSALFRVYKTSSIIPAWDDDENEGGKEIDKIIGDLLFGSES